MKDKILNILIQADGYISGQRLCEMLGVSRTAIWKVINKLKEEGYVIKAISNKGYCLMQVPDKIEEYVYKYEMKTKWIGKQIICLDEVNSTNTFAKKIGDKEDAHGCLIITDNQIAGRGRRGRSWSIQKGEDIACSLVLKPQLEAKEASMLTLIAAMAVQKGISYTLSQCQKDIESLDILNKNIQIKWPNDIVYNKKKVCGILTEMNADMDGISYVIIGIGINVNKIGIPEELKHMATSIKIESGITIHRAKLVSYIMEQFEHLYDVFMETKDFSRLKKDYESYLVNYANEVVVLHPKESFSGICRGISEKGDLIIEDEKGNIKEVFSGEVSVRGIYGYV